MVKKFGNRISPITESELSNSDFLVENVENIYYINNSRMRRC